MSRTITMRLSNEIIAACYDYLETAHIDTKNRPMASVVPQFLGGVVTSLRNQAKVPSYSSDAEAKHAVDQRIGMETDLEMDLNADDIVFTQGPAQNLSPATIKETATRALDSYLEKQSPRVIDKPSEVYTPHEQRNESEQSQLDLTNPPWLGLERVEFAKIKGRFPKNQWVELGETDPIARITLEVVCAQYGQWGTDLMDKLCAQTFQIFAPYKQAAGE